MRVDIAKTWNIFVHNIPLFQYGIEMTLLFAFVGTFAGFVVGLLVGGIRAIEINEYDSMGIKVLKRIGRIITGLYIWVFRGTPMMVQAMFIYYLGKPVIGWTPITAGLIIISINTGAYMAEIIRSGIQSVDKGQNEAAMSLGMTTMQTLMYVVFPQAIKNSFPSIGNQLIVNIKDSSMLNVITVTELYFQTTSVAGSNYRYIETLGVRALPRRKLPGPDRCQYRRRGSCQSGWHCPAVRGLSARGVPGIHRGCLRALHLCRPQ